MTRRSLFSPIGPLADTVIEYGTILPDSLYVLCITLLYWVITPIILPIATIFFGATMLAWKYQFLYVIQRQYESGGKYWYGLYNYSMLGLFASTITMMAYMSIKEGISQAPLLVPLPILIIFMYQYMNTRFEALSKNIPYSTAVKADANKQNDNIIRDTFTETFLKHPPLAAKKEIFPYPYRIDGLPLIDNKGEVNRVYVSEQIPAHINPADEFQKYHTRAPL
jgi:hypothetical protein